MSDDANHQAQPGPSPAPASAHAPDRLVAYAAALGVADAARLAAALRQRAADAGDHGAAPATADGIAALDGFLDELAARVADDPDAEPRRSPAAVRFTLARHLAALLTAHPDAPADPAAADAIAAALARHHDVLPGGVLPTHPHQEMPRQPLGALPAVLRSQFWTSAYRFGPFGNRRNSAAADDSPRPSGVAENASGPRAAPSPTESPA